MKRCSKCENVLPESEFYQAKNKSGTTYLLAMCKECSRKAKRDAYHNTPGIKEKANERSRKWKSNNKEHLLEYKRTRYHSDGGKTREKITQYARDNKDRLRVKTIERTYGVPIDYIVELRDSQKGCCAICGDSLIYPDSEKMYNIDHCHNTGKVRGLLCSPCNLALGKFKEDVIILQSAVEYLNKYKDIE